VPENAVETRRRSHIAGDHGAGVLDAADRGRDCDTHDSQSGATFRLSVKQQRLC